MGTLNEELLMGMLRNFYLAQLDLQAKWEEDLQARMGQPPVWSWTPGTFVFPEGLCCYCGGVMRSAAIWQAKDLQFYGSWKVVGDGNGLGHFDFSGEHPHVNHGAICMGGSDYPASSVADALFLAFNPLSMYFEGGNEELKEWFEDRFDHACEERVEVRTIEGINNQHLVAPEAGCHCQHCRRHRKEVQCPRETCRKWYEPRVGHGRFKCKTCNSSETVRYCIKHRHDQHRCVACRGMRDLWDVRTGELAAVPQIAACEDCKAMVCTYCLGQYHQHGEDGELIVEEPEESEGCEHHCADCCRENNCEYCHDCGAYREDGVCGC